MSDNLNINVLVAAKEEYTKQLVYILSPEIYIVLNNVFKESQQMKKKRSISLRNYQILLKKIPLWNTILIEQNTKDIKCKIPYLLDLITAIFVSHIKILACVRLKADSKSIQVKVPNLDHFLHKIIITNAEKIYYNPDIIMKKKEFVIELISETIEETIRNQIPIDKILTEYLAGVFDEENSSSNQNNLSVNNEHVGNDEEEDDDDEEDNDEDDDFNNDISDEDDELGEQKNIIPTRPIPEIQLPNNKEVINEQVINDNNYEEENIENEEDLKEYLKQENYSKNNKPKERVLFSDAIEKSLKDKPIKHNNEMEGDSDDDDDDEDEVEINYETD